jgi:hypothetical protein
MAVYTCAKVAPTAMPLVNVALPREQTTASQVKAGSVVSINLVPREKANSVVGYLDTDHPVSKFSTKRYKNETTCDIGTTTWS